jgi:G3E family GTPase
MLQKIPVTVLTGFLGSGKTTLLNRILAENHGQRIAVIENEFGEIGVDQELVINADEEVFEMNNGCICCTVRGDLIRILGVLLRRRDRFDRIVLETTGLANPGPVAQTFFVDDEIKESFALDGIVTLVDAKHIVQHLDDSEEAREQLAFADVIVLNKTDLVSAEQVASLERRIRGMNAMARIERTQQASVAMDRVLGLGGFDLARALEHKPDFLEPEYPFEWAGLYESKEAPDLRLSPGPDPSLSIALIPWNAGDTVQWRDLAEKVFPLFSEPPLDVPAGATLVPGWRRLRLATDAPASHPIAVAGEAAWLLFTQHRPEEFALEVEGAVSLRLEHDFAPAHGHDDSVTSVSLESDAVLDEGRFDAWLGKLLQTQGNDLFRMKGILDFAGADERIVIQGVHMLVDSSPLGPWGERPRRSQLVLIGRNLDEGRLRSGFRSCAA